VCDIFLLDLKVVLYTIMDENMNFILDRNVKFKNSNEKKIIIKPILKMENV
jgi:hypothetical protein